MLYVLYECVWWYRIAYDVSEIGRFEVRGVAFGGDDEKGRNIV